MQRSVGGEREEAGRGFGVIRRQSEGLRRLEKWLVESLWNPCRCLPASGCSTPTAPARSHDRPDLADIQPDQTTWKPVEPHSSSHLPACCKAVAIHGLLHSTVTFRTGAFKSINAPILLARFEADTAN